MNTSEVLNQIIKMRKSTFPPQFTGEKIRENVLNQIIDSAEYAPNHKKTRPWRFRLFQNDEKSHLSNELMRLYQQTTSADKFSQRKCDEIGEKVQKSDAVITLSVNFSGQVPQWEEIAAMAMAVQNMYLTCTAHQVGCYWGSPGFVSKLNDFLKLEENQACYGLFFMGKM